MIHRASLFLIALSLAACTPVVHAAPANEPGVTPAATQSSLDQARARWRAAGITSYRVHVERSCFCRGREPVDVEVRNGAVTSVRITETGAEAPREQWEWTPSIDAMFTQMSEALRAGTEVRAEYHPTLGYPTVAVIGTLANDAGTQYNYTSLTPLR
ncbi:MAG TPA: DUF6174 domain-containing protein [Longimicrobium sp.]|jgi:hypothetical protein|uniref:DUF6174 domain-containing protein n=1 Tax=Longimicrobium sp. TaxID=2029185 RepID=UPI002EDAE1C1